eukprot:TRINITY_DN49770_c0_g1_i1.p2 TRINITY_DN49770_c0_g1~~TRINITY_DN49770_c0_g1_i1.p2  ORF type:complete len:139 (-),score=35.19 TRINITY_DN49770_c0_g1_i1:233-649(-)
MYGGTAADAEAQAERQVAQKRVVCAEHLVAEALGKQRPDEALREALAVQPYQASRETQEAAARLVLRALGAVRDAEVRALVGELPAEDQDLLMKYLYRFWDMGLTPKQNAHLFTWHAALVEHAGVGVIARAMYDWRWP